MWISYPSPANFAPGDRELDVLANLLGGGKSSRLYKKLVYELKIAQAVSASQDSQLLASDFEITRLARCQDTRSTRSWPSSTRRSPPSSRGPSTPRELDRAKNQIESETVRSLEGLQPRAERLQHYNYLLGDPGFLAEDVRHYRAVEPAAIQRVAQQVLRKDGRVIITVTPNPQAPIMGRVVKK